MAYFAEVCTQYSKSSLDSEKCQSYKIKHEYVLAHDQTGTSLYIHVNLQHVFMTWLATFNSWSCSCSDFHMLPSRKKT